jgi:hypothetical protein
VSSATLEQMPELDFKSPFDELSELRTFLTTQQIAELTGLRRETISRARPDSRFRRSTEKALGDLYAVVERMRFVSGGELGQLAAVLRRPQPTLGERSIAELLREGKVGVVLDHLGAADETPSRQLENIQLDDATLTELRKLESEDSPKVPEATAGDDPASVLIDADPEIASLLPAIEGKIRGCFGDDAGIERRAIRDHSAREGSAHLYLGVRTGLPFDEALDRLADLLGAEADLLAPVSGRLTIGTL